MHVIGDVYIGFVPLCIAMQNVMNRVDNHFGLFDMALNWTHNV